MSTTPPLPDRSQTALLVALLGDGPDDPDAVSNLPAGELECLAHFVIVRPVAPGFHLPTRIGTE